MPTNKNAFIRYRYLDKMLSERHHCYSREELTEKVNEQLRNNCLQEVTKRTIEHDLEDLTFFPFFVKFKEFRSDGKNCITYKDPSFSIFKQEMTREERNLLREVLNTIGEFDGLDNFEWLEKFKKGLGKSRRNPVISFSNNPYLVNSNLLGTLFDMISNKAVVRLSYHTFADATIRSIDFHPYLLKQYNDRWYLLGAADSDKAILSFPLDRIDSVELLPGKKYEDCPEDLLERFEDIVGVTLYKDRPIEHTLCWVSDASRGYVETKPIHGSQTPMKGEQEQQLRTEYPHLEGGMFFTLDCINNYELVRELCSYGKELIVLRSEGTVADDVRKRVSEMAKQYNRIEK